jgi:hypothetical protein
MGRSGGRPTLNVRIDFAAARKATMTVEELEAELADWVRGRVTLRSFAKPGVCA